MKKIFMSLVKLLLVILYPVVVVLLIVASIVLFLRTRDITQALNTYEDIYDSYEIAGDRKTTVTGAMKDFENIISGLYEEIETREAEIGDLQTKISSDAKEGYGEIQGSILAFVSEGATFNKYQLVCAETEENPDKQYCVSVSAIGKRYSLLVPEGSYRVFAMLQNEPENTAKAYYTEYVKCNIENEDTDCSTSLSDQKILIPVGSGDVIENIDPIDWQIEGLDLSNET